MLAKQKTATTDIQSGDFVFVINDAYTYHSLDDFRNSNAKSIFSQAMGLEQQLENMMNELNEKRNQYASESVVNSNLRASILELERESGNLLKEVERLKIQARNEEIRSNFN